MARTKPAQPPLVITMGEPAGIGPEIILKAWQEKKAGDRPFFYMGGRDALSVLDPDTPLVEISHPGQAYDAVRQGLPVLDIPLLETPVPGRLSRANGSVVIDTLRQAITLVKKGEAGGLVTAPIHKKHLYESGFKFSGHTEYLARKAGLKAHSVAMMLAVPGLRVVPVTVHLPLSRVSKALSAELIVEKAGITHRALKTQFGIRKPRIAVAALNPHAGEDGALGHEEEGIIAPAIEALQTGGIDASGPYPADTLFHPAARKNYDAVLCMYHDQALIPVKTIDFDRGVNVTLGLPFVRTSPDHGTALDIAGQNKADPTSLLTAIDLAGKLAAKRHA